MPAVLLLVDASAVTRHDLGGRLQRRGVQVHVASSTLDALAATDHLTPDVVLVHLRLPERGGIDAIVRLRAHSATSHLPVIGLVEEAFVAVLDDALAAGCDDVETMPVDVDRLLEKIRRWAGAGQITDSVGAPGAAGSSPPSRSAEGSNVERRNSPPDSGSLLLVDDDAQCGDSLACRFERMGYSVRQAAGGPEALAMLAIESAELVLLNLAAPAISGLDVLRAIRDRYPLARLPVILARDRSDSIADALDAGASDYLTRPIDVAVALTRVRTHLKAARAERALRVSEERYELAARGSNDGLFDWDLETDRVYYSERWASLLGLPQDQLVPRISEWISRVHPAEQAGVAQELRTHIEGLTPSWESEHRIRHADGHYRWMLARGVARRTEDGRPVRLAGSLADVTHAKVADPLTGLPNRLLFLDRMHHALAAARVSGRPRFAVLFMDMDGFKVVNDSLGHVLGDDLLVQVSSRLEAGIRRADFAAHLTTRHTLSRLGGDEFAVLLEDIVDQAAASAVAERLQQVMQAPFLLDERPVYTTLSIGIVLDSPRYTLAEELMRDADAAMYRAKRRGRGQCEVFTDAVLAEAQLRQQVESDLAQAIERHEIVPYYQPIVHLATGALEGFEALVRWRHPHRGLLSPDAFLAIAEETSLIVPLTYQVVSRAAQDLRRWRDEWHSAARLTVSVNMSPCLFSCDDLVPTLVDLVHAAGVEPVDVKLEIVEGTLLAADERVMECLVALRRAGFALALDDFGTGYSALGYLHAFPLSTLKIDGACVSRMNEESSEHVQMVRSIVSLAHNLGMDVTAEGIETPAQVRWLQVLECVRGQGYFFERPLAPEVMTYLLAHPHFSVPEALATALPLPS